MHDHVRPKDGEEEKEEVTVQKEQIVAVDAIEDALRTLDGDGEIGSDSPSKCAAPIDCID